jgi:hypothetical protein
LTQPLIGDNAVITTDDSVGQWFKDIDMQTQFQTAYANWQSIYAASESAEGTDKEDALYAAEQEALNKMLFTPSATGGDLAQKLQIFIQREIVAWDNGDKVAEMLIAEASKAISIN